MRKIYSAIIILFINIHSINAQEITDIDFFNYLGWDQDSVSLVGSLPSMGDYSNIETELSKHLTIAQTFMAGKTGILTGIELNIENYQYVDSETETPFFTLAYRQTKSVIGDANVTLFILEGEDTESISAIHYDLLGNQDYDNTYAGAYLAKEELLVKNMALPDNNEYSFDKVQLTNPIAVDSGQYYTLVLYKKASDFIIVEDLEHNKHQVGTEIEVMGGGNYLCGKSYEYDLINGLKENNFGYFLRTYVTECPETEFSLQPQNIIAHTEDTVTFTSGHIIVDANFKWQVYSDAWEDIGDDNHYSGSATNSLKISGLTKDDHLKKYRVKVQKGNCGPYYSFEPIVLLNDTCINIVNDTNRITVTDTLIIDIITGNTPNLLSNTIKCYPNPTLDMLYISNNNYQEFTSYQIEITNQLGLQLFITNISSSSFNIDMSTWGTGLYFVNIINEQNKRIDQRKIIKQ